VTYLERARTPFARRVVGMAVGMLAMLGIGVAPVNADSPPKNVGSIVLTTPDGDPITKGNGLTPFFAQLPPNSTCPGDSANDQWRVQTFFIPSTDDPLTVKFGPAGPTPLFQGQYPMYFTQRWLAVNLLLLRNPGPGKPGRIPSLPALNYAGLVAVGHPFPGGRYRIGVACTFGGVIDKYWDTEVTISSGEPDKPEAITWTALDAPVVAATPKSSSLSGLWITLAVLGAAAAIVSLLVSRSRNARSRSLSTSGPTSPKEPS